MSLFAELKRRNVIRVGVAYLVATWLLLQVVDVLTPILELPDWAPKLILVILVLGFVPVLIFAWAFELTPEGIKRESRVDRDASITHVTARKLDFITIGLLAAAILIVALDRLLPQTAPATPVGSESVSASAVAANAAAGEEKSTPTPAQPPAKSVAVLPFVNMSEDAANEYFSDGISEEILNALARVPDLKVAGRTSSFAFKDQNQDLRLIGEALGVSHILEGSVRKAGNRVRITAQLIQASDGFHVWSENFDRELDDVFAIQDEISAAILQQLKAHLAGEEPARVARTDTQAYELYLLAKQRIYERNQASLELAADLLRQTIAIDPAYAPAHAQLGIATLLLADVNYGTIPLDDAIGRTKALLDKALELDPQNAEALAGMGLYHNMRRDNASAIAWLERAVAINPSLVDANLWLSTALSQSGELRRGLEVLQASFARDPLHPPTFSNYATVLCERGRTAEAREKLQGLRRFVPGNASLQGTLGAVEVLAGNWAAAERLLTQAIEAEPLHFVNRLWYSSVLFTTSQFERLEESGVDPWIAVALNRMERREEALMRAERMARRGQSINWYLQLLAENGRFEELVSYVEDRWPELDDFEAVTQTRDGYGAMGLIVLAQAYGRLEREAAFFEALRRAQAATVWQIEQGADNWILTMSRAALASLEGDREAALDLLEGAVSAGALPAVDLEGTFSLFSPLRGDPRFEEVLQRIRVRRNAARAELGLDPLPT
jgi:TolB-like protein/Tfp pilus assembly protein PilF